MIIYCYIGKYDDMKCIVMSSWDIYVKSDNVFENLSTFIKPNASCVARIKNNFWTFIVSKRLSISFAKTLREINNSAHDLSFVKIDSPDYSKIAMILPLMLLNNQLSAWQISVEVS